MARHILGEVFHVIIDWMEHHFFRGAYLHELPVLHDGNAVAHFQRFQEVVGDEYRGLLHHLLKLEELILHVATDEWIERAERFIEQENLRVHRESPGKAHALLHTTAQLPGVVPLPAGQPNQLQYLCRLLHPGGLLDPLHLEAIGDVVDNSPVGEQPEMLKHHAHLVAAQLQELLVVHGDHVLPIDNYMTIGGLDEARQAPDQGGFAAARQTHDHKDLALAHIEGDILDSG